MVGPGAGPPKKSKDLSEALDASSARPEASQGFHWRLPVRVKNEFGVDMVALWSPFYLTQAKLVPSGTRVEPVDNVVAIHNLYPHGYRYVVHNKELWMVKEEELTE